jgi:RNA polymerase sigma factor (sigma-70 family)
MKNEEQPPNGVGVAEQDELLDLIRQVQSGDGAAWTKLVQRLQPFMHRVIRIRMRRRADYDRLRHDVGASDVCQSVFESLFRGFKKNRYELNHSDDLLKLLQTMIRFNLATKARRASVRLRELLDDFEKEGWIDRRAHPEQEGRLDLIDAIQERFSGHELDILLRRLDGHTWEQIADQFGCARDAVRKRLARAIARLDVKLETQDGAPI